jgi:SNF2 family DNA or RNA helicase
MTLMTPCGGAQVRVRDAIGAVLLYLPAGKFELLDRMLPKLKAGGHRVLIFCQASIRFIK